MVIHVTPVHLVSLLFFHTKESYSVLLFEKLPFLLVYLFLLDFFVLNSGFDSFSLQMDYVFVS